MSTADLKLYTGWGDSEVNRYRDDLQPIKGADGKLQWPLMAAMDLQESIERAPTVWSKALILRFTGLSSAQINAYIEAGKFVPYEGVGKKGIIGNSVFAAYDAMSDTYQPLGWETYDPERALTTGEIAGFLGLSDVDASKFIRDNYGIAVPDMSGRLHWNREEVSQAFRNWKPTQEKKSTWLSTREVMSLINAQQPDMAWDYYQTWG